MLVNEEGRRLMQKQEPHSDGMNAHVVRAQCTTIEGKAIGSGEPMERQVRRTDGVLGRGSLVTTFRGRSSQSGSLDTIDQDD